METISFSSLTPKELEFIENIKTFKYGPNPGSYYTCIACLGRSTNSLVSQYALPYLVRTDLNPKETDRYLAHMFAGLEKTIKPQFTHGYSAPLMLDSGQTKLTQVYVRLSEYYALEHSHNIKVKSLEEEKVLKYDLELKLKEAREELGELKQIGRKKYWVGKDGCVYEEHNHTARTNWGHVKIGSLSFPHPNYLLDQRGKKAFNTMNEAEHYWIEIEAKCRIMEQERHAAEAAKTAERERRVQEAMFRLKNTNEEEPIILTMNMLAKL
jgi:hypothetical protein